MNSTPIRALDGVIVAVLTWLGLPLVSANADLVVEPATTPTTPPRIS